MILWNTRSLDRVGQLAIVGCVAAACAAVSRHAFALAWARAGRSPRVVLARAAQCAAVLAAVSLARSLVAFCKGGLDPADVLARNKPKITSNESFMMQQRLNQRGSGAERAENTPKA